MAADADTQSSALSDRQGVVRKPTRFFTDRPLHVPPPTPPPKTPLLHPAPLSPMAPPPGNMGGGPIQQLGSATSFARVGNLGRLERRLACAGLSPPVNIPPGSPMFRRLSPPTSLPPLCPLCPPCHPPVPPRSEQPSQFSHCVCVSGWLHPAPCFLWSSLPVFPFSCLLQARGQALPATGFWRQHRWVWQYRPTPSHRLSSAQMQKIPTGISRGHERTAA